MEKKKSVKPKTTKVKKEKVVKPKIKKVKTKKEKVITDLEGNIIKSNETNKDNKKKLNIKKHINKYKRVYLLALSVLLFIAIIILGYIGIRNYILSKKYGKYEEKMDNYGFSLMYNNQTPKSYEKVTRNEMVKMILSSIYNTSDITNRGFVSKGEFENDNWADLAKAIGIIEEDYITKENYNEIATKKEAIIVYLKARSKLLDIPVTSTRESGFKNLNSFTQDERSYINDATENGLIEDKKGKLKIDGDMFKGEFNMLVVKFIEKYNTVAPEGETLVTKEESKPKNYNIYPYILYSVDKEAYEYKGINEGGVDYKTPLETYKYKKDYYEQVEYRSEVYYNAILNVDYRNINKESFFETTNEFLRYDYTEEINNYVDYVKENQIIIEGNAKVQFPIFYLDGISYRARIKLTFEIKNANTDKNLLLGDSARDNEVTYNNKKYEIYVDAPMGTTLLSKALLLDMEPIIDLVVSSDIGQGKVNEF